MSTYKGYTDAQRIATAKYRQKMGIEKLSLDLPKGKKAEWKAKAESKGLSLTAYIAKLIEADN